MSENQREINRRLSILRLAREHGNIAMTCRYFGIGKSTFYVWRARFEKDGVNGLAKFHWHVEDTGVRHVYIKPRSPQLNGKVERSHRSDQEEFYQLLDYTGDVDLRKKLEAWEHFYNFNQPHGAHHGKLRTRPLELYKMK